MKIYNTLTGKKEELKSIKDNEFNIYSCGPTVYDYFHIGNARPFIVFDTLRRYLEFKGNKVNFVQNFTDIDDKIINRANEENLPFEEVSEKYIDEYFKDAKSLNIKKATHHPKVSENIDEIIKMINTLIDKGFAYVKDGDIYFKARSFKGYGKLSKKNIDELEAGARVSVNENKDDPLDFALWKKAKENEPSFEFKTSKGEILKGRPGWHIECSAMSKKYLGDTIDIHGGGSDLIFPHHENEIAQSESANGKTFSNYFMHNGYININNKKMSKSLGNFKTVRDILKKYDGEVIRYLILSSLYRSPINFSDEILEQAKNGLEKLIDFKAKIENQKPRSAKDVATLEQDKNNSISSKKDVSTVNILDITTESKTKFIEALDDDFNTAKALGEFYRFVNNVNKVLNDETKEISKDDIASAKQFINDFSMIFGLLENNNLKTSKGDKEEKETVIPDEVKALLEERKLARENKDFAKSDELRDKIFALGYKVLDTKDGQDIVIIS